MLINIYDIINKSFNDTVVILFVKVYGSIIYYYFILQCAATPHGGDSQLLVDQCRERR